MSASPGTQGGYKEVIALIEGGVQADLFAARTVRPQILAKAPGIVRDQCIRSFQDGAGGAVVLL